MSSEVPFIKGSFVDFFGKVRLLCGDAFMHELKVLLPFDENSGDVFHLGKRAPASKSTFSNCDTSCGKIIKVAGEKVPLEWFLFKDEASLNVCLVCFSEVKTLSAWLKFLVTCEAFTPVFPIDSYLKTLFDLEYKRVLNLPVTLEESEKVKELLVYPSFAGVKLDAAALKFDDVFSFPFEQLLQRANNDFLVSADSDEFYLWSEISRQVLFTNQNFTASRKVSTSHISKLFDYQVLFEYYESLLNKNNFSLQDYDLIDWASWKVTPLSFEKLSFLQELCHTNFVAATRLIEKDTGELFLFPVNGLSKPGSLKRNCIHELRSVRLFNLSLNNFFEINGVYFILSSSFLLHFYSLFTSVTSVHVTKDEVDSGLVSDASLLFVEGSVSSLSDALFVVRNV